jgi:hypothetical protein
VQALRPSVFLAHAPEDRDTAARIGAFLDRGADITLLSDEGQLRAGEDLAEKARQGCMADIVVMLFSRHSLPPRWPRAEWEDALVKEPAEAGVRIAFVRCDDCNPPRVLAPKFELSELRELKRWVRGYPIVPKAPRTADPDVEVLGIALADRAGAETAHSETSAAEFMERFAQDFDGIVKLDCGNRTPAAVAGDMAEQLELRLEGPAGENWERLRRLASERRLLIALRAPREGLEFEGRSSVMTVPGAVIEPDDDSIRGIQHALRSRTKDWIELCRRARLGRRLLRDAGRIAELFELMEQWRILAEVYEDLAALDEASRELAWILEGWGEAEEARSIEYRRAERCDEQMVLGFE